MAFQGNVEALDVDPSPRVLLFSAKHPNALQRMLSQHQAYHLAHPSRLRDMSFSLALKRDALSYRAFCVTDGLDDWTPIVAPRPAPREPSKLVFVFSGQGAQWAQMGMALIKSLPEFRESLRGMDKALHTLPNGPQWSLIDEILAPKGRSRITSAELSQPCCTAIQVALVDVLQKYNVTPGAVVGHSSGEIAAAYASGAITSSEAIAVAYYRGKVMALVDPTKQQGGMAAVGLGREAAELYLESGVLVGCENSPESTTLTGDKEALGRVMQKIKESNPEILVRELHVDRAYHSREQATFSNLDPLISANAIALLITKQIICDKWHRSTKSS